MGFEVAISESWSQGSSIDTTVTCSSGGEKDNAWLYGIYLYDVKCAQDKGRDSRFRSQEEYSDGCALSVYMAIEEGYVCTAGREEPPCCGPGANAKDTVNRKYCEDDFKSWTGQCDGYVHRTRVSSLQDSDGRCINFNDKCSDLLSPDLGGHLANCGANCGDSAYRAAEHFVRSQDVREFIPIYYNNWYGAFDGRRALAAEDVFEFEHCKCDTECPFWGDCCDDCKEAMEKMHDMEFMSEVEMVALRSLRATMTEEGYVKAKDDFENETSV